MVSLLPDVPSSLFLFRIVSYRHALRYIASHRSLLFTTTLLLPHRSLFRIHSIQTKSHRLPPDLSKPIKSTEQTPTVNSEMPSLPRGALVSDTGSLRPSFPLHHIPRRTVTKLTNISLRTTGHTHTDRLAALSSKQERYYPMLCYGLPVTGIHSSKIRRNP